VSAPTRALTGSWPDAVRAAFDAVQEPLPVRCVPVAEAAGCALGQDLRALTDLPAFPTSAMDGYAVAGELGELDRRDLENAEVRGGEADAGKRGA